MRAMVWESATLEYGAVPPCARKVNTAYPVEESVHLQVTYSSYPWPPGRSEAATDCHARRARGLLARSNAEANLEWPEPCPSRGRSKTIRTGDTDTVLRSPSSIEEPEVDCPGRNGPVLKGSYSRLEAVNESPG
jgi:hypothetical protein